jgi:hypothetical protein
MAQILLIATTVPSPDPEPLVRGTDPDPDPNIIKQKMYEKPLFLFFCDFLRLFIFEE